MSQEEEAQLTSVEAARRATLTSVFFIKVYNYILEVGLIENY